MTAPAPRSLALEAQEGMMFGARILPDRSRSSAMAALACRIALLLSLVIHASAELLWVNGSDVAVGISRARNCARARAETPGPGRL